MAEIGLKRTGAKKVVSAKEARLIVPRKTAGEPMKSFLACPGHACWVVMSRLAYLDAPFVHTTHEYRTRRRFVISASIVTFAWLCSAMFLHVFRGDAVGFLVRVVSHELTPLAFALMLLA